MAHYVIISGGRDQDGPEIHADMGEILGFLQMFYGNDLRVLHGAARGVDSVAQETCDDLGITVKAYPADWDANPRAAGVIRNRQMADLVAKWSKSGHTGELIAFRGGNGTENMVKEALERDIPVTRVPHDETMVP